MSTSNPVPAQDAPAEHPAVGDRYTCRTQDGIRSVTVTRVWDLGDGATVAIEWPGSGGEHRMSLDVFTGASRRLCSTPGPEASICDLPAGHASRRHEELGYGRLTTWTDEQPDDAAIEEQQEPAPGDACRVVDIGGESVRVRGSGEMSDESRAAVASLVGAARRRHAAEQARHDDQVRAAAYREAADALDAHRCTQTGTTPGVVLPCDHRPADLLRALADGVGVEPAVQDAQDAAATLRRAALLADAEGDSAARDRLRARADEISGHDAQAGGEQQ